MQCGRSPPACGGPGCRRSWIWRWTRCSGSAHRSSPPPPPGTHQLSVNQSFSISVQSQTRCSFVENSSLYLHVLQSSQALQRGRHLGDLLQTPAEGVELTEDVVLTGTGTERSWLVWRLWGWNRRRRSSDHLKSNCLFSGFSLSLSLTPWKLLWYSTFRRQHSEMRCSSTGLHTNTRNNKDYGPWSSHKRAGESLAKHSILMKIGN